MEVAANVVERDELGQLALGGSANLAVGLSELRLYVVESQPPVDLGLGRVAGNLAGLGVGDSMLGHGKSHPHGALAKLDAVLGGAREMLEQVSVGVWSDDSQVDCDPVVGGDPGTALTGRSRGGGQGMVQ